MNKCLIEEYDVLLGLINRRLFVVLPGGLFQESYTQNRIEKVRTISRVAYN